MLLLLSNGRKIVFWKIVKVKNDFQKFLNSFTMAFLFSVIFVPMLGNVNNNGKTQILLNNIF